MNSNTNWWTSGTDWFSDFGNGIGNVGTNNGQGNAPGTTGNGNFNVGSGNGNNNGGSFNGSGNVGGNNGNNNGVGNMPLDEADTTAQVEAASADAGMSDSFDWRGFLSDLRASDEPAASAQKETADDAGQDEQPQADAFEFVSASGQGNTGQNNGVGNIGGFSGNDNTGDNNGNNNVGGVNGNNNGNDNFDAADLPLFDFGSWQDMTPDWGDFFA
ncbi:MAG: hypothetical protein AAFQ66_07825 [Pseudomonadota bacterium]